MKRRHFTALIATLFLLPSLAIASNETIEYEAGSLKKQLDAGKTVFVDYYTYWCSTCKRQSRIIKQLRAENPTYNEQLVFMSVNWTVYEDQPVSTSRNIPRRSTLILLRGDKELGRIVAGTSKAEIKALLDKGLR